MKPVLLTTVHDPEGKLLDTARCALGAIAGLYSGIVVEMTDATCYPLKRLLSSVAYTCLNPAGDIAGARRNLIHNGVGLYRCNHFHFVDFDRLLHWHLNYPVELSQAVALITRHKFIVFGRTKRAFRTHPFCQRETERLVNLICGMDVLTASRGICPEAARFIKYKSKATGPAGVDVEWPLIARRLGPVMYLPVEGLEYESDTFGMRRTALTETRLRVKNMWQGLRVIWSERLG